MSLPRYPPKASRNKATLTSHLAATVGRGFLKRATKNLASILLFLLTLIAGCHLWVNLGATTHPVVQAHVAALLKDESNRQRNCLQLATMELEPYSSKYRGQEIALDGPVYAYHAWEGASGKAEIEKHQLEIQKNTTLTDCRVVYKVYKGELYVYEQNYCYQEKILKQDHAILTRFNLTTDLVLLAMEVYNLPDMDFVITMGDREHLYKDIGTPLPSLAYCVRYKTEDARGFAIPAYETYRTALGEHQLDVYRECLQQRFPQSNRISKAVWRGSTTGPLIQGPGDLMKNPRVALAFLGAHMPELFDVALSSHVQMNASDTALMKLIESYVPLKPAIEFEQFNSYGAVIDVDGNTWSERLAALLRTNTPVLKQSYSNWMDYFGHLLEDEVHVRFFDAELLDLVSIAEQTLNKNTFSAEHVEKRTQNQFEFAKEHCSQLGVIRAQAYAMLKMTSYMNWEVGMEEGYLKISRETCCQSNKALPHELVSRVQSSHSLTS